MNVKTHVETGLLLIKIYFYKHKQEHKQIKYIPTLFFPQKENKGG